MTSDGPDFLIVGSREVRRVPAGWRHPRDERGRLVPLLPFGYPAEDAGAQTMPAPIGELEVVAYEAVSEGTPISLAFPDTLQGHLDLVNYCAEYCTTFDDHRAGGEAWAAILFGDGSVGLDGTVRR